MTYFVCRPVSLRTASSAPAERAERGDSSADDFYQGSLLRNNWAISKTAQYRKMKSEWKNYVLLSRSRIQGLGLFATRDIDAVRKCYVFLYFFSFHPRLKSSALVGLKRLA